MPNLLYIAPQDSLPYTDGGKIGVFFPLRELAKKYNVFYAFPYDKNENDVISKYKPYNITAIPFTMDKQDHYSKYPKTLFSELSFKFSKYFNREFLEIMDKTVKENDINIIWVSSAQMAKYAVELKKRHPELKIFLREHNIEYMLVKQYIKSRKNIFMKLIAHYEYRKTKRYEIGLWKKFNKVFFISDTDIRTAKKYNKNVDESNLIYDGMEFVDIDENIQVEPNSFIFTASLKSYQNENNLKYFIANIWKPFVKKVPEAKLYLTGNKDEFLLQKLKMTKEELEKLNIINLGFVDDIKKTILSKQYVVSPTLFGSGIRLKVLEGMSLKKLIFVSDIDYDMASCLKDLENVLHYSNADEFYEKYQKTINNPELCKQITENAYKTARENFDWEKYAQKAFVFLTEETKNEF